MFGIGMNDERELNSHSHVVEAQLIMTITEKLEI